VIRQRGDFRRICSFFPYGFLLVSPLKRFNKTVIGLTEFVSAPFTCNPETSIGIKPVRLALLYGKSTAGDIQNAAILIFLSRRGCISREAILFLNTNWNNFNVMLEIFYDKKDSNRLKRTWMYVLIKIGTQSDNHKG